MTELGKTFRKWRVDRETTLDQEAEFFGVSRSFLSAVERGQAPMPVWMLRRLPDYFRPIWLEDAMSRDEARRESA